MLGEKKGGARTSRDRQGNKTFRPQRRGGRFQTHGRQNFSTKFGTDTRWKVGWGACRKPIQLRTTAPPLPGTTAKETENYLHRLILPEKKRRKTIGGLNEEQKKKRLKRNDAIGEVDG